MMSLSEGRRPLTTNSVKFFKAIEQDKKFKYFVNMRGIITPNNVGLLIGQRGSNLLAMSKQHDVLLTLSISNKQVSHRLLNINGEPRNCANAWTFYVQKCTKFDNEQRIYVDFIFPHEYIVFAEEESLFERIALESLAEIRIHHDFLPNSTEHIVKVSIQNRKYLEYFYRAVKLIAEHAHKHPRIVMSCPDNQFYDKIDERDDDHSLIMLSNSNNVTVYNPL